MENTQLLFEEGVPLAIHNAEREDVHTVVTVKIQLASRSPTHRKVLHTQLTDDSDPFFFYSLYLCPLPSHTLPSLYLYPYISLPTPSLVPYY